MRNSTFWLLPFCFLALYSACKKTSKPAIPEAPTTTIQTPNEAPAKDSLRHCPASGEVLNGNQFIDFQGQKSIAITAPSSELGHRLLQVFDATTCTMLYNDTLPENTSPDFPYYLTGINYGNANRLIAIRGAYRFFLYQLETNKLLGPFRPTFPSDIEASDSQSGMLLTMELWENYLVGYAQDFGSFVFDVHSPDKPVQMAATVAYQKTSLPFQGAFVLSSVSLPDTSTKTLQANKLPEKENLTQVIVPVMNYETGKMDFNPVFEKPLDVTIQNTVQAKSKVSQRYWMVRNKAAEAIVVDLKTGKKVAIPSKVDRKSDMAIQAWTKTLPQ